MTCYNDMLQWRQSYDMLQWRQSYDMLPRDGENGHVFRDTLLPVLQSSSFIVLLF